MIRVLPFSVIAATQCGPCFFGIILLWLCLSSQVSAIDPLPPALENASAEDQNTYIERFNNDMMRDKMEVARERFDRRMRFKTQMTEGLKSEAETRRTAIQKELAWRQQQSQQTDKKSLLVFQILVGILIFLGMGFLFHRRINNSQFVLPSQGN